METVATTGLRERKRRETRQRIIEAGMRLFLAGGFDATTLDAIAAAANISRRTFFSYFESKEDVVMAWEDGAEAALRDAVVAAAPGRTPLDAVRAALTTLVPVFESHDFLVVDGVMRSTPALRARKHGHFERQERALVATLAKLWPEPERRTGLRVVAMAAIGGLRLATEAWTADGGVRPITAYLDEAFRTLGAEVGGQSAEER